MTRPTRESILKDWAENLIEFSLNRDPSLANYTTSEIAQKYKNVASREFIDRFLTSYAAKHLDFKPQLDSISKFYQDKLGRFTIHVSIHYLKALSIWAGFMSVLYLTGLSIAWVYRGFKQSSGAA